MILIVARGELLSSGHPPDKIAPVGSQDLPQGQDFVYKLLLVLLLPQGEDLARSPVSASLASTLSSRWGDSG